MLNSVILKIKRGETPFYQKIYKTIKALKRESCPTIPFFHKFLYFSYKILRMTWATFKEKFILTPIFRSMLSGSDSGLRVSNSLPFIMGDHIEMVFGRNVTVVGQLSIFANKVNERPKFYVGDDCTLGWNLTISCGEFIYIGDRCKIASDVSISDNNGHPLHPNSRNEMLKPVDFKAVFIGNDVWIGAGARILKGVTIGSGSIIGAGAVVSRKNIPRNSIVFGNPCKIVPLFKDTDEHNETPS